ncbi:MAG TPA: helix-turn-helix transcriptional regulator [Planctomycetota bacterium]|nr:helix-turn-helix transcriptional regulator [Planctomycetota bacterium]
MARKAALSARKRIKHADIVRGFATRLRQLRHSRGMSQTELATRAQLHWTYVGRLERGEATPGIDLVARLADALGSSLGKLLPDKAVDPLPLLQKQAKARFELVLGRGNAASLSLLNAFLMMLEESVRRGR